MVYSIYSGEKKVKCLVNILYKDKLTPVVAFVENEDL